MNFKEAMHKLKLGGKVSRNAWNSPIYFMMVDKDVKSFQSILSPYLFNEDIMISEGWWLEEKAGEHSFSEIIPFLQQGHRAKLKDWKDMYIFLDKQTKGLVLHSMQSFQFLPDFDSFTATDWIEI